MMFNIVKELIDSGNAQGFYPTALSCSQSPLKAGFDYNLCWSSATKVHGFINISVKFFVPLHLIYNSDKLWQDADKPCVLQVIENIALDIFPQCRDQKHKVTIHYNTCNHSLIIRRGFVGFILSNHGKDNFDLWNVRSNLDEGKYDIDFLFCNISECLEEDLLEFYL